jgi:HTH-type transcriptional regulator/antitoxin HigA
MATDNNRLVPARAIHPGEVLREELQERGIKQKDFAQQIGMQASHLNAFINGKRNLNDDLAIKLEQHLGIPFKFWMSLHNDYIYDKKVIQKNREATQPTVEHTTRHNSRSNEIPTTYTVAGAKI